MTGEYPVIINGKTTGKLTVSRHNNRIVFSAVCALCSGVTRLSAYGGGKEIYLGVMQPENGQLRLKRAFTPNEMKGFPACITHAGLKGERPSEEQHVEKDILWSRDGIGLLWTETESEKLCAIPRHFRLAMRGEELESRNIEGTMYRIFKIGKNDR